MGLIVGTEPHKEYAMSSEAITRNDLKAVLNEVLPSEPAEADYVVEQGTSGIWTYRKWSSGIAECWGKGTKTLSHYSTAGGFYGYYTDFALPSGLFTSITAHVYTSTVGNGFAMSAGGMGASTTTSIRVYALSSISGSRSCAFDMMVKGRWK